MKILEVKNNLVKISYTAQDNLVISGFVIIEDSQSPYVAQVMSLKADSGINYAIVKLLFTFNAEGVVKNYNGTIPELNANITRLSAEELLDILPIEIPFPAGKIAQQDFILNIDYSTFDKNLLICADNIENTDILLSNIAKRITENQDKSVIFDSTGTIEAENKLVFGKDFKLPLNYDTINFIYEHDLNDVEPTSKAIIQDILIEVQEYSKTLLDKFIPFDLFIAVIDAQTKKLNLPELALLKNKLLKYKNDNAFAQEASEIHSLRGAIRANLSTLLDISNADSYLQKLIISTVYNEIDELGLYVYSLVKIDNENSDKRLLKKFINTNNKISTIVACPHNYRYLHDLKEIASNMFLFTPQTVQHDFSSYNVFLNKLNPDECVVFGKATQNIPLIIEMMPIEMLHEYQNKFAEQRAQKEAEEQNPDDAFNEASDTYSQDSMMEDSTIAATESVEEPVQTQEDIPPAEENETQEAPLEETETTSDETVEDKPNEDFFVPLDMDIPAAAESDPFSTVESPESADSAAENDVIEESPAEQEEELVVTREDSAELPLEPIEETFEQDIINEESEVAEEPDEFDSNISEDQLAEAPLDSDFQESFNQDEFSEPEQFDSEEMISEESENIPEEEEEEEE